MNSSKQPGGKTGKEVARSNTVQDYCVIMTPKTYCCGIGVTIKRSSQPTGEIPMRHYSTNSAEACARLLAMFLVTDGDMDSRQLEVLEKLNVYDLLNLPRKKFTQVLSDYCDDISDEAGEDGTIHLLDRDRVDSILSDISDHRKRILLCVLAMDISKSDGTISDPEMALLSHMMKQWSISLDDLEREFAR
ncbi:hypothetical protein HZU77_009530 [Neisseriaceae bacterium TC5R-5]|nr:hypothetical protein [Neisseriaceae bacterium TC5R-5]